MLFRLALVQDSHRCTWRLASVAEGFLVDVHHQPLRIPVAVLWPCAWSGMHLSMAWALVAVSFSFCVHQSDGVTNAEAEAEAEAKVTKAQTCTPGCLNTYSCQLGNPTRTPQFELALMPST